MNISSDLASNILLDWKKKDISAEEKSVFIKSILKERNISQRELAKEVGISHSTLQDWVSMRQISKHKLDMRVLNYNNKSLDSLIERVTFLLSKDFIKTDKTIKRLEDLREEVNKILLNLK